MQSAVLDAELLQDRPQSLLYHFVRVERTNESIRKKKFFRIRSSGSDELAQHVGKHVWHWKWCSTRFAFHGLNVPAVGGTPYVNSLAVELNIFELHDSGQLALVLSP
jgi:hypothetical protein